MARIAFGILALSAGCVLIALSGSDVLADPTPDSRPVCNDLYEDTQTAPCLDTAVLCDNQTQTACKQLSSGGAKQVMYFPKQCILKTDHWCGDELLQCHRTVDCKWVVNPMNPNTGDCLPNESTAGPWVSLTGRRGTSLCD